MDGSSPWSALYFVSRDRHCSRLTTLSSDLGDHCCVAICEGSVDREDGQGALPNDCLRTHRVEQSFAANFHSLSLPSEREFDTRTGEFLPGLTDAQKEWIQVCLDQSTMLNVVADLSACLRLDSTASSQAARASLRQVQLSLFLLLVRIRPASSLSGQHSIFACITICVARHVTMVPTPDQRGHCGQRTCSRYGLLR